MKTTKKRVVGYIIVDRSDYQVMSLGHYDDTPEQGVMLWGGYATLFSTRSLAQAAIKRTKCYADKKGLKWGDNEVISVRPA